MSQLALARAAGVAQATISNYELGRRDIPTPVLIKIIAALDVPLGELVETAIAALVGDRAN
jgi:transcriptional regulator with XRE-family HTH domain